METPIWVRWMDDMRIWFVGPTHPRRGEGLRVVPAVFGDWLIVPIFFFLLLFGRMRATDQVQGGFVPFFGFSVGIPFMNGHSMNIFMLIWGSNMLLFNPVSFYIPQFFMFTNWRPKFGRFVFKMANSCVPLGIMGNTTRHPSGDAPSSEVGSCNSYFKKYLHFTKVDGRHIPS